MKTLTILSIALLLSGCATDTGRRVATGTVVGGTTGAIIGNQSGRSYEGAAIGAGVGDIGGLVYDSARKEEDARLRRDYRYDRRDKRYDRRAYNRRYY
jgi:uncharacterized protein YcfJ